MTLKGIFMKNKLFSILILFVASISGHEQIEKEIVQPSKHSKILYRKVQSLDTYYLYETLHYQPLRAINNMFGTDQRTDFFFQLVQESVNIHPIEALSRYIRRAITTILYSPRYNDQVATDCQPNNERGFCCSFHLTQDLEKLRLHYNKHSPDNPQE